MEKKYLNEVGLADVATHVNSRLKTVTTMPVSADNGAVRLYVGTTSPTYTKGHTYQYNLTNAEWVDITPTSGGGAVDSVNGKTGIVVLNAKDIGLQYDSMPNATVDYVNQIVQYTGVTDSTYTNGYFYKCVYDGTSTYSWELVADFALASDVYTKTQIGALTDLPDTTKNVIQNIDNINTTVGNKADKVSSATNGDIATLDSNGNLIDGGILVTDVLTKSNTSGLVKNDGSIDENTYATTTQLADKVNKVTSATNGDLASLNSSGDLIDSGILATNIVQKSSTTGLIKNDGTIDTNTYLTSSDIADKANKVSTATNGDLAGLDSNGDLTDSGILATNVIVKSSTAGLIKNDGSIDTNAYATTIALGNKADKVSSATANDFATLDSNGNLTDSGINKNIIPSSATSSNQLATANDIPTELNDLSDDVVITNPVNAQILAYNSTSHKWENQTGQAVVGGAVFKGSILFANLPTTGMINGDWYDIKDAFVTDSTFEEGAGISCAAGTDVIWVADDNKWNILTPSGVYSFNGRTGAVSPQSGDYSKSDVGLGNVVNTGDSATPVSGGTTKFTTGGAYTELNKKADKVTGTFTSGNFASLNANGNITDSGKKASDFATDNQTFTQASTRTNIASGESFSTIFGKIMKWFADLKDLAFISKPNSGQTTTFLRGDGTWVVPTGTTYDVVSKTANGLAPQLPNETTITKYLRQDGNWAVPPDNNTWTAMVGATSSANGSVGYVNAVPPKDGYNTKYLRADGTWTVPAYPSVPSAYTSNPAMNGTASAGSSTSYAKGDHRHPSDTSKADKVTGTFTSGDFAGLDANGNITDSGSKASDFSTVKSRQTPTSGGTTLSLVNTGDMYTWNNKASTTVVSKTANGLAPKLPNETTTTKFLRQDGSWAVPSYPTVNNATLTIQRNGSNVQTFTANASSDATANILTDIWTATAIVQSDGTVTFSSLDDSLGYDLYCQNKLIGVSDITKTGSGTSTTLKYTVTGAAIGDVCKLRILR